MVKLSEQINDQRITRTERVRQKQEERRVARDLAKKKAQAQKIQEEKFANVNSLEEYSTEYYSLDPEMQQYFSTPAQVQDAQDQQIETTKQTIQERISIAKANRSADIQRYAGVDDNQKEQREVYWNSYIYQLQQGLAELNKGKNISYNDINRVAEDYAGIKEANRTARNEGYDYQTQQAKEVRDLEAQGYKPFVVEESSGGKTQQVFLEFFNPNTNTFRRIETFKPARTINLAGYTQSDLGRAETTRTLSFAGKDFEFKSNVQLFKDQEGNLATKFGSVGKTENEIIQEARDQAYKDYLDERSTKPKFDEDVQEKELRKTFVDRWLKSPTIYQKGYDWLKDASPKVIDRLNLGEVSDSYQGGLKRSYDFYKDQKSKRGGTSIVVGIEGSKVLPKVNLGELKSKVVEGGKAEKERLFQEKLAQVNAQEIEAQYQQEYQLRFEDKYIKDIIYGEKTFDQASEEFKESDTANLLSRNYEVEITEKLRDLKIDKTDLELYGASTVTNVARITPTTYEGLAISGVAVAKGSAILKAIPPSVSYTATGLFGLYGGYKAFSPTSTGQERIAGAITAGISAGVLTYGAVRYLRKPTLSRKQIIPDVDDYKLKAKGFEGSKDLIVTKDGQVIQQNIYFPEQKLQRQVISGSRTVVSTKFRDIFKLKPIYQGIPTQQLGKSYTIRGLRGSSVITKPSAYQKALKRLTQYGYSTAQAQRVLRFNAPRVIDINLDQGVIITTQQGKTQTAIGQIDTTVSQPVINLDGGIKTRGAKPYRVSTTFERSFADKSKSIIRTDIYEQGKTYKEFLEVSKVKAGAVTTGNRVTLIDNKNKEILINTQKKIQELTGTGIRRRVFPTESRSYDVNRISTEIIKSNRVKVKLYDIDDLLRNDPVSFKVDPSYSPYQPSGLALKPAKIKKTPFSKTFKDPLKNVIKNTASASTTSSNNFNRVVKQINSQTGGSLQQIPKSAYYGTGQYERTIGGVAPYDVQIRGNLPSIDQGFTTLPNVNVKNPITDAFLIKGSTDLASGLGLGASATTLRGNNQLKDLLKNDFQLRNNVKLDQTPRLRQDPKLRLDQSPALRLGQPSAQPLRTNLQTDLILPRPTSLRTPTPSVNPTPFVMPSFDLGKEVRKRKKKKEGINLQAYLPDFTSRALGLNPTVVSEKQAQALLKKQLTGLEIRRGVIVR